MKEIKKKRKKKREKNKKSVKKKPENIVRNKIKKLIIYNYNNYRQKRKRILTSASKYKFR